MGHADRLDVEGTPRAHATNMETHSISQASQAPANVVVGFDREPLGMTALDAALDVVRDRGPVRVHVIHVRSPVIASSGLIGLGAPVPVAMPPEESLTVARERLERHIDAHMSTRALDRSVEIIITVCDGNSSEVLLDKATELGASLVVVGTHRKSALARFFDGSVSQTIVRDSPCPVLVVHENDVVEALAPVALDMERDTDPHIITTDLEPA